MHRRVFALCTLLVLGVACSDDEGSDSTSVATLPGGGTAVAPGGTGEIALTTTTLMPDCAAMPTPADLSTLVGVALDTGQVTQAGTCEFLGLNDQSRSVVLSKLVDPVDQTAFTDLQASLGASTPLDDPALPGAMVSPTSLLYMPADGAIYVVQVLVTDQTPAEQLPLAVSVLTAWLAL
jgi:hypothetical protein